MESNAPSPTDTWSSMDKSRPQPQNALPAGGPATDSALLRIGAVVGICGVLLQVAMDQMHPAQADANDSPAAFTEYSHYGLWTIVHIGQFLGTLLLVLALLTLARALSRQRGLAGALAVIGAVTASVAVAVFAVQMALDGVALRLAIQSWVAAPVGPGKTAAFQVADGLRGLEKGLSGIFHVNNGLTLVALGLSIALGHMFAKWLGVIAILAGSAFFVGGIVTAETGFAHDAGLALTPALLLFAVFMVGVCISMWRRASAARVRTN